MKKYVDRIIVRLTAQQLDKLKKLAQNKNLSDIIRKLIEDA